MNMLAVPSQWGPVVWKFLHTAVLYYQYMKPSKQELFKFGLVHFDKVIPCPTCRPIYIEFMAENPIHSLETSDALLTWTIKLHNRVNAKLDLPEYDAVVAASIWALDAAPIAGIYETLWNMMYKTGSYVSTNAEISEISEIMDVYKAFVSSLMETVLATVVLQFMEQRSVKRESNIGAYFYVIYEKFRLAVDPNHLFPWKMSVPVKFKSFDPTLFGAPASPVASTIVTAPDATTSNLGSFEMSSNSNSNSIIERSKVGAWNMVRASSIANPYDIHEASIYVDMIDHFNVYDHVAPLITLGNSAILQVFNCRTDDSVHTHMYDLHGASLTAEKQNTHYFIESSQYFVLTGSEFIPFASNFDGSVNKVINIVIQPTHAIDFTSVASNLSLPLRDLKEEMSEANSFYLNYYQVVNDSEIARMSTVDKNEYTFNLLNMLKLI